MESGNGEEQSSPSQTRQRQQGADVRQSSDRGQITCEIANEETDRCEEGRRSQRVHASVREENGAALAR